MCGHGMGGVGFQSETRTNKIFFSNPAADNEDESSYNYCGLWKNLHDNISIYILYLPR
jgi:hypothetical protein